MKWYKSEFEICSNPSEGDTVQFAVLSVFQLRRLDIPNEEVKFFMREINEDDRGKEDNR